MAGRRSEVTDLSNHIQQLNAAHVRLDKHEGRLTQLETQTAVAAERDRNIQMTLGEIKGGLGEIKGTISWITRLVIGGIVMGAVGFLIAGGFNVP